MLLQGTCLSQIVTELEHAPHSRSVVLQGNEIWAEDEVLEEQEVQTLSSALAVLPALRHLDIGRVDRLHFDGPEPINSWMQLTTLTWLSIASCFQHVSPRSTENCDLSAVLGEMEELRYLDVSAWYEDAAATVSICGLSAQLSKLEHLQQLDLAMTWTTCGLHGSGQQWRSWAN